MLLPAESFETGVSRVHVPKLRHAFRKSAAQNHGQPPILIFKIATNFANFAMAQG